jgi:hypothetical protein
VTQGEQEGLAVDEVRVRLHRDGISAFIPDVGGSSLCCERIAVLDSGLLTNRYLAAKGYGSTGEFLAANRPDVIEAHWPWAEDAGLYEKHYLDGYEPVGAQGLFLFVREDLYRELLANGQREQRMDAGPELCGEKGMPEETVDRDYMARFPRCIHLPD